MVLNWTSIGMVTQFVRALALHEERRVLNQPSRATFGWLEQVVTVSVQKTQRHM